MIEHVAEVVAERLRADAPFAWISSGADWRSQKLEAFYSTRNQLRTALDAILLELGLSLPPSQYEALLNLYDTVAALVQKISAFELSEKQDIREHRGHAEASEELREEPYAFVRVFFGTDREPLETPRPAYEGFGPYRSHDGEMHYGNCLVSMPAGHRLGALESPSWFRFEFKPDPRKHVVLHELTTVNEDLFFDEVAKSVAASPSREAFVFVHGFNVSFSDAVKRTAQIAYDLNFKGAPIAYSWPSNGRVLDYSKDEANAIWTVPHLERFLDLLLARSGAERLHLIAHSMGNRAVCDALERRSRVAAETQKNRIHHLVLTAPDIDADTFKELAANVRKTAATVTLYASANDKAIRLSCEIHGNPRAGTPLLIVPGVETVDASNVDTDFLGHGYFSSARSVLSDIYTLFGDDHLAGQRFGVNALQRSGETYYVIKR